MCELLRIKTGRYKLQMEAKCAEGMGLALNISRHHLPFWLTVRPRGGNGHPSWSQNNLQDRRKVFKELLPVTPVLPCEQQPGGSESLHHHWQGEVWCHTYPASSLYPVAEHQIQLGFCHCKGREFMNLINAARMTPPPWELHEEFSVFFSLQLFWLKGLHLRVCGQL